MAIPPAGCRLPDCLPGLHCGENPPGQAGDQQYPKGIKAIYLALGVNMEGRKELLGLYPVGINGCQKTKVQNSGGC